MPFPTRKRWVLIYWVGDIIWTFHELFVSCAWTDNLKLDSFDLKYLSCGLTLEILLQVERNRIRLKRQDEKAAKEANKLRMNQINARAKEGELSLKYKIHKRSLMFHFYYQLLQLCLLLQCFSHRRFLQSATWCAQFQTQRPVSLLATLLLFLVRLWSSKLTAARCII